jgi:uncharacterized protein (DUF302 family)
MRQARLGAVLLVAALGMAGSAAGGREASGLERTPHFLIVRVRGPFDEVMLLFQEAIKRRNYGITGINDLDEALGRRAADMGGAASPYQRYKVIGFCNLTLADEAIRLNPHAGTLLPCRAVVFRRPGADETVIVAIRPSFLVNAVRAPGMERIMEQVEADIHTILKDVSGG